MQLYFINWSFQNNEDKLFATNEFWQYLKDRKLKKVLMTLNQNTQSIPRKTDRKINL